jgi:hypothetical protein
VKIVVDGLMNENLIGQMELKNVGIVKMTSQLKKGIRVESEHTKAYNFVKKVLKKTDKMPSKKDFYKAIAKDHLKEDKGYYDKLKRCKL